MLSIALIFNDLKNLTWFKVQLCKKLPARDEISAFAGQHGGMSWWATRQVMALFFATLEVIEKCPKALEHGVISLAVGKMSSKGKSAWDDLVHCAKHWRNPVDDYSKFEVFLHAIRSKGASHYDPRALLSAYDEHFTNFPDSKIYVSSGNSMEATRHYFADLAAQRLVIRAFEEQDIDLETINRFTDTMNEPIKVLLDVFLVFAVVQNEGHRDPLKEVRLRYARQTRSEKQRRRRRN